MERATTQRVAIVDYGLGNLFSVQNACLCAGLTPVVSSSPAEILAADAAVLPGVGAFGDAIKTLDRRGLSTAIREFIQSGRPFVGVCLGMQLLMRESEEFGCHQGLGIVEGRVTRLDVTTEAGLVLKIPQVGWNAIDRTRSPETLNRWEKTLLNGVADGEKMYFVHSYVVQPLDPSLVLTTTKYGSRAFCSSLQYKNVTACQFHPERSGPQGMQIYRNLALQLSSDRGESLESAANS